jgi:hypothetical protein
MKQLLSVLGYAAAFAATTLLTGIIVVAQQYDENEWFDWRETDYYETDYEENLYDYEESEYGVQKDEHGYYDQEFSYRTNEQWFRDWF